MSDREQGPVMATDGFPTSVINFEEGWQMALPMKRGFEGCPWSCGDHCNMTFVSDTSSRAHGVVGDPMATHCPQINPSGAMDEMDMDLREPTVSSVPSSACLVVRSRVACPVHGHGRVRAAGLGASLESSPEWPRRLLLW